MTTTATFGKEIYCPACGELPGNCWADRKHAVVDGVTYDLDDDSLHLALHRAGEDSTPILTGCGCDEIRTDSVLLLDDQIAAIEGAD